MAKQTKTAGEVQVGDKLVERDGCLLEVSSAARQGADVVLGIVRMGPAYPTSLTLSARRRVAVFVPDVITDPWA